MSNGDEGGQSVLCTAIMVQEGKIALKETEKGLALPGGHVDWAYGSTNAVPMRIHAQHKCGFWPKHISSMLQHRTANGDSVVNVTYVGKTKTQQDSRGLVWLTLEELAHQTCEPHARRALERYREEARIPLDFVRCMHAPRELKDVNFVGDDAEKVYSAKEFVVSGGPLKHMHKGTSIDSAEYAFQECARAVIDNQHADNVLSFFGGKAEGNELPLEVMLRERSAEGVQMNGIIPHEYIGLFINDVLGQRQPQRYSANFSIGSTISYKVESIPKSAKAETRGITWLNMEEIERARQKFRTPDTYLVTKLWHDATRSNKPLYPLDLIQRVE